MWLQALKSCWNLLTENKHGDKQERCQVKVDMDQTSEMSSESTHGSNNQTREVWSESKVGSNNQTSEMSSQSKHESNNQTKEMSSESKHWSNKRDLKWK